MPLLFVRKFTSRRGFAVLAAVLVIGVTMLEVNSPGTIASILSKIVAATLAVWNWLRDVSYALRELPRRISNWY